MQVSISYRDPGVFSQPEDRNCTFPFIGILTG